VKGSLDGTVSEVVDRSPSEDTELKVQTVNGDLVHSE
jgi:hypothetical protein